MAKFAIIQNDTVVRVVEAADPESVLRPQDINARLTLDHVVDVASIVDSGVEIVEGSTRQGDQWIPPSPFPSWVWDGQKWMPPVPVPDRGDESLCYYWDESAAEWVSYPTPGEASEGIIHD